MPPQETPLPSSSQQVDAYHEREHMAVPVVFASAELTLRDSWSKVAGQP
jgi:hypothetical protein